MIGMGGGGGGKKKIPASENQGENSSNFLRHKKKG